MKTTKRMIVGTLVVLGATSWALAQDGKLETTIRRVDWAMSYEPGQVSIHGTNLGLVWEVRVDGQAVPVLRNNGWELVIDPGARDPGFAGLELVQANGVVVPGRIEFTPCLSAVKLGDRFRPILHPGERGYYWLHYSYELLGTPSVTPGVYYMELLDLGSPASGMLEFGYAPDGEVMLFPWQKLPRNLGIIQPLRIQAFCLLGADEDMCYTNMITVRERPITL